MWGRKRQVVVNTDGLIEALAVQPADEADATGGQAVVRAALAASPTLELVWADTAIGGWSAGPSRRWG